MSAPRSVDCTKMSGTRSMVVDGSGSREERVRVAEKIGGELEEDQGVVRPRRAKATGRWEALADCERGIAEREG